MKAFLVLLLLLTTPAFAGTTITVSVGGISQTWTLSDTDQQKFEAWVKSAYQCNGAKCVPLTLEESETQWALATLKGTSNNVQQFQNMIAATAAMQATTPVGLNMGATKK